jgi:SpoVK/Ycf46/Vps4 family AAA+-type ATPase
MKADEVIALVRAHVNGDQERFRATALAIAANVEGKSQRVAKSIRSILDQASAPRAIRLPDNVDGILEPRLPPNARMTDLVVDPDTRARIVRVLAEQAARDRLAEHGLRPTRKLLFTGPPGVGKTMTASVIAGELVLPMIRVELHGLLSQYLGETGRNLAKAFAAIRQRRAVYLFDEFDGISAERGDESRTDVSEMRRVVNTLLQLIENDDSDSIIIGATNHAGLVDRAMFRRFDDVIAFPLPTPEAAEELIRSHLLWSDGLGWGDVRGASSGLGHADLVAACAHVNKDAVLDGRESVSTLELVAALGQRKSWSRVASAATEAT